MPKFIDLTGQRFGRLTVSIRAPNQGDKTMWECICSCPKKNTVIVQGNNLKSGHTESCGCIVTVHGHNRRGTRTPEYYSWKSMMERCYYPKHKSYLNYGGRGITVCDSWHTFNNYLTYLPSLGPKPSPKHTPDRIENNGNYEPGNMKWSDKGEQARNRRSNIILTYNGQTKTITEWAESLNIYASTIRKRLDNGWSIEKALTEPSRKTPYDEAMSRNRLSVESAAAIEQVVKVAHKRFGEGNEPDKAS